MKKLVTSLLMVFAFASFCNANAYEKARVIIMSDIGGSEPDDQESFVRFLLYSNEMDIVGIIGANSQFGPTRGDINVFNSIISVYEKIRPNLLVHAEGYPTAAYLKSVVKEGQRKYVGMNGVGSGYSTAGSNHIIQELKKESDRPLWFLGWGGLNTLSQALWELKYGTNKLSDSELAKIIEKVRIYDIAGQDNSGAWIAHTFPGIYYLRSGNQFNAFSYKTGSAGQPFQEGDLSCANSSWFDVNVQNHGELGKKYPDAKYMYEGDTPSFLFLLRNGLNDPEYPYYGSWGGRFKKQKEDTPERYSTYKEDSKYLPAYVHNNATDTYTYNGKTSTTIYTPLWRWRQEYQNDFAARMDWTINADFSKANHAPNAVVNSDNTKDVLYVTASAGSAVSLSADETTDPDGNTLSYKWWNYAEPGTYSGNVTVNNPTSASTSFTVPSDAEKGDSIHIVLSVTDNGSPALTSYRRIVIVVGEQTPIKIVSLGNSITQAKQGYDSYRRPLWKLLQQANYNVDFVGSMNTVYSNKQHPVTDFDVDHEGHWGWRADEIANKLPEWLKAYTPDIVLLLIGSNDLGAGESLQQVSSDIKNIITILRTDNPNVTILLGNILPTTLSDRAEASKNFNKILPDFVNEVTTSQSQVFLVDHYSVMNTGMMYDGIHPSAEGEKVLAQSWFNAIDSYVKGGINTIVKAPTNLIIKSIEKTQVEISWNDNSSNETLFAIERKTGSGTFEEIATVNNNITSYTDASITLSNQYQYRVAAKNSTKTSEYSNSITLETYAPTEPKTITVSSLKDKSVVFAWKTQENTAYIVERSTDDFATSVKIAIKENGKIQDLGLSPLTEYAYKITAENTFGTFSNTLNITTLEFAPIKEYTIKLNLASETSSNEWNALGSSTVAGTLGNTIYDTDGEATEVSVKLLNSVGGIHDKGKQTGNDSGIFPDQVMKYNYYTNGSSNTTIGISGLDTNLVYKLTVSASRDNISDDRYTIFTIGNIEKKLNARNNTTNGAIFENINAVAGTINLSFKKDDNASYAYIGGIVLEGTKRKPTVLACFTKEVTDSTVTVNSNCSENTEGAYFLWDMGDGTTAFETELTHTYSKSGTYTITLTITDSNGNKFQQEQTVSVTVEPTIPPATPSSLEISKASYNTIQLAWLSDDQTVESFIVERSSNNGDFEQIAETDKTTTSIKDNTINPETEYSYRVSAKNSAGISAPITSNTIAIDVACFSCEINNNIIALNSDCSENIDGATYSWNLGDGTTSTVKNPTHTYAASGDYSVKLTITDSKGIAYTEEQIITAKVIIIETPPATPNNVELSAVSYNSIKLTWTNADTNAKTIIIERSTNKVDFEIIATLESTAVSCIDKNLKTETEYSYRIYAQNAIGTSTPTAIQSITTSAIPELKPFTVLLDFANMSAEKPWNSSAFDKMGSGNIFTNTTDTEGNTTSISVSVPTLTQGIAYGAQAENDNGIFPNSVLKNCYWISNSNDSKEFVVSGLHSEYTYDITLTGSRSGATDQRLSVFTIGEESKTVNAASNTNEYVLFENIKSDQNGTISIVLSCGTNSTYAYINGAEIKAYPISKNAPSAPAGLTAQNITKTAISLTWEKQPKGADGIIVECAQSNVFTCIDTVSELSTLYINNDLTPGTEYKYRLKAYNSYGSSEYSNAITVQTIAQPQEAPQAPENVSVTKTDMLSAKISWAKANQGAVCESFIVEKSTADGQYEIIAEVNADIQMYEDADLVAGTEYTYQIKAKNEAGTSEPSEQIRIATDPEPEVATFTVYFDFANTSASKPWNSSAFEKYGEGTLFSEVKDAKDNLTNITVTTKTVLQGNKFGVETGNNSGVFPDENIQYAFWVNDKNKEEFIFSGLSDKYTYDLKIVGSRTGTTDNRISVYSVGSVSDQIEAASNYKNYALLKDITVDEKGEFTLIMNSGLHSSYAYINALELNAKPISNAIPATPINVSVISTTASSVSIAWETIDNRASAFIIERADTNGNYAQIGEITAGNAQYTDKGLDAEKTYTYRVIAKNAIGQSEASALIAATTDIAPEAKAFNVLFDFANEHAEYPWNSCEISKYGSGIVFKNVEDSEGNPTSIIVSTQSAIQGNDCGVNTGNDSGIFPDAVLKNTIWVSKRSKSLPFVFAGLSTEYTYSLVITASRANIEDDRISEYSVGEISASLNVTSNYKNFVLLEGIEADENGEFTLVVSCPSTSSFAYINGAELIATPKEKNDVEAKSIMIQNVASAQNNENSTSDQHKIISNVYPSIAENWITIEINSEDIKSTISLVTANGYVAKSIETYDSKCTIDFNSNIISGNYYIKVENSNGFDSKEIIVKR